VLFRSAADELTPDQAVQALLDGTLRPTGPFCRCHE
jgi:hypothetical protein